jgi:hypothetical protein
MPIGTSATTPSATKAITSCGLAALSVHNYRPRGETRPERGFLRVNSGVETGSEKAKVAGRCRTR